MLSYPLRLAFQRVRVICKIRNYFLFAVLRDSKCIRAPPVASELFDTSCAVWVSQTITSFLEIKYQNKENNRQWGSQSSGNNWQVYYPLVFNSAVYGVWVNDYAAKNNNLQYVGVSEAESSLNGFKMYTNAGNVIGIAFFAIGR